MITLLLADDHTYIRKGLRNLIEATTDMEVVATVSNGIEAIAKACSLKPDIVVIDISMPLMDGIEATRQIRECSSQTRVLALSIHENREYIESALQAGAAGYVLKDEIGNDSWKRFVRFIGGSNILVRESPEQSIHTRRGMTIPGQMNPT